MQPGHLIKAARAAAGLTQVQAAAALGTDNSHLSKIESDQDSPSLALLLRMAVLYRCSLSDMLPGGHEWSALEVASTPAERAWLAFFRKKTDEAKKVLADAYGLPTS